LTEEFFRHELHCNQVLYNLQERQTLVLFSYSVDKKVTSEIAKNAGLGKIQELVQRAVTDGRFKAGIKESVFFRSQGGDGFEHVLVVGLGDRKKITDETLRSASAIAVKALSREKVTAATVYVDGIRKITKSAEGIGRAMAEGAILGAYKYDELKSKKKDSDSKELKDFFFVVSDKPSSQKFGKGLDVGSVLGECTNFARDLGNAPGNYLTPAVFDERLAKAVKRLVYKIQSLWKKK